MKPESLSQHFVIPCYDTDVAFRLKPASFMDFAQEIAQGHASLLGFGYDDLQRTRTAWVLSRLHIKFLRHPLWREEVDFKTWHKGTERLFFLRDFLMTGADGKPAALATSSWLVLNLDTRRLVRSVDIDGLDTKSCEHAIETPCDKVQMPKDVASEIVAEHLVSYSDVDMNGHTNNARYVVWAMDAIGYDVASSSPVREIKINFNHETRPGETVVLHRAVVGDVYYVEGEVDGRSAFCVEIMFQ